MPTFFCNSSSCGYPIKYTIAKPAECPRCGVSLKAVVAVAKPVVIESNVTAANIGPITTVTTYHAAPPSRRTGLSRASLMQEAAPESSEENQGDDAPNDTEESDVYDKAASKRLARQLIANLKASGGIRIEGGAGNERVRLGDWVKEKKEQE